MNRIGYDRLGKIDFHLAMASSMLRASNSDKDGHVYETNDAQRILIGVALTKVDSAMEKMNQIYQLELVDD